MTCPKCHSEFGNTDVACPECGVHLLRNVSGVMKTSAVMIAARGEHGFYHSVQDVPEPLRTQLIETTTSPNSGIIVIADRAGKEQLTKVMARREARSAGTQQNEVEDNPPDSRSLHSVARLPWLAWAGFVGVLALSAIVFAAFQIHW
jgi:hypothetical protein